MTPAGAIAVGFCPSCGAQGDEPCSATCAEDAFVEADEALARTLRALEHPRAPKREVAYLKKWAEEREAMLRAMFKNMRKGEAAE